MHTFIVNKCIHSYFLKHPDGSVSVIIRNDKVRLTRTIKREIRDRISIFEGFKATVLGCGNVRVRFIKTHGRSCEENSHGPVIRTKPLTSSRLEESFAVGTVTFDLRGRSFKTLISPFNNVESLTTKIVHAPLSPSAACDSSPLEVIQTVEFTAGLAASGRAFAVIPRSLRSVEHGHREVSVLSGREVIRRLGGVLIAPGPSVNFGLLSRANLLSCVLPRLSGLGKIRAIRKGKRGRGFSRALRILSGITALRVTTVTRKHLGSCIFRSNIRIREVHARPGI